MPRSGRPAPYLGDRMNSSVSRRSLLRDLTRIEPAMNPFGFLRVAAATPQVRVADCAFNAQHVLALMRQAEKESVQVLVFPELALTGYTCGDLFHQPVLQRGAVEALVQLVADGADVFSGLAVVGLPLVVDDRL